MNYAILARLLSIILASLAFAQAGCLGYGLWVSLAGSAGEEPGVVGLAAGTAIASFAAALAAWFGRRAGTSLHRKEALAVIGTGWFIAGALGAVPFAIALPGIGPAGAFFESVSGFTTTGASVIADLDAVPRSLLAWRSVTQWIGGLGVVVFFVAILSSLGAGSKILFSHEASAGAGELDATRIQNGVRRLVFLYLGLSAACLFGYRFAGLEWFEAFCHMGPTISTGGFSTHPLSVGGYGNVAVEWVCIVFMILGGMSFPLLLRVLRREATLLKGSSEVAAYLAIIAASTLMVSWALFVGPGETTDAGDVVRTALFQVVTIMTTAGFATDDFNLWLPAGQVVLVLLMVVGGCSGSTAGGVKVGRLVVALKLFGRQVEQAFRPHLVRPITLNGRVLPDESARQTAIFLMMMALVAAVGILVVAISEPAMSFTGVVTATLASLFNVGPGLAEVGPMANYAFLHDSTKVFLSILMIMGRVELLAVLVLFSPSLWRRFS